LEIDSTHGIYFVLEIIGLFKNTMHYIVSANRRFELLRKNITLIQELSCPNMMK
jgi:hypothetical protein